MGKGGSEYVYRMEAVLDVYERPYDPNHPVICLDESPKQIISEVNTSYMDAEGVLRQDYEYKRQGVKSMYMVTEPLGGYREVYVEDNHNSTTYAKVLKKVMEGRYSQAEKVTLIEDNLSAHKLILL
jgi:phage terminase large subunit GpA-like protein